MSSLGQWDGFDDTPTGGTNRSAPVRDCRTCGGDLYVLTHQRRPEQTQWMKDNGLEPTPGQFYDEYSPCPSCNPVVVTYWSMGRKFQTLDAAQAREALRR